jgi:hypothetical protein
MSEAEKVKKSRGPKRTKEEIAADKRAWLLKHEWGAVVRALSNVECAALAVELARTRASAKVVSAPWQKAKEALDGLVDGIKRAIPAEALPKEKEADDGVRE